MRRPQYQIDIPLFNEKAKNKIYNNNNNNK